MSRHILKLATAALLSLPGGTIRCDVDGQLMPLKGSFEMRDGHLICDLHVRIDRKGRAICPIDGSVGRR